MELSNIQSTINIMYHAMLDGDNFGIEKAMELVDLDDVADTFIHDDDLAKDNIDLMGKIIQITRYIEFETPISSTLSDDRYDQLVEKYHTITGKDPTTDWSADTTGVAEHRYPELRGTLNKVHFIATKDIPPHDSRKSLEEWWGKIKSSTTLPDTITLSSSPKYDGHSVVFEMSGNTIVKALTRYRTDLNLGKDITHIFTGWTAENLDIPLDFARLDAYGVKAEVYMKYTDLTRYKEDTGNSNFNHRSAVASILGRNKGNADLLSYLSVASFQIASSVTIEPRIYVPWMQAGLINDRYQYIRTTGCTSVAHRLSSPDEVARRLAERTFDAVKGVRDRDSIPMDGIVVTITDEGTISQLGRKNDINQFQIAYKFPTGVAKTKLKRVTFPVGPCAGTITPLAELEPVTIDGKEIKSASLSNMEKLERLDLRVGDEVIIRYDIIPKLYKDKTCARGKGPKVVVPNACPSCGGELSETYRCTNPDCPSKIPGKIYNFVTKMRIPNIGKQTIEKLVSAGIWSGIHSLYKIPIQKEAILALPGFGERLIDNMITGIGAGMEAYPHELFGALGIPDLASKTMKTIFQSVDLIELTSPSKSREEQMEMLTSIKGIGEKKAEKFINGIRDNAELIEFLESHVTIRSYEDTPKETPMQQNVVFTQVRDKGLEAFLKTKGIGTSNTVSAKTVAVITQNELFDRVFNKTIDAAIKEASIRKTSKIKAAEERNIPIISIDEYKKKVGYLV